jgi:hypothetical protein
VTNSPSERPRVGVLKAILVGQLVVNLPAVLILLGLSCLPVMVGSGIVVGFLERPGEPLAWLGVGCFLLLLGVIGFGLAWLWWAFTVPRWRQWALKNGAPPERLQQLAVATGLVWPKGWIFEKSELRPKDRS